MKKTLQITSTFLLFLCISLSATNPVEAKEHSLDEIQIHTFIHEDGSATITEVRKVHLSEGTENFDVIENLGQSRITDFTVIEDGKTYEFIDNWNIDANREDKTFKNGIIETTDGYELVWGIGEYGKHIYELQYTVTDFIKQTKSREQILFWRYVNDKTNIPPKEVKIEIEADYPLSEDDERIWAFGFEGDINFVDGKVIATSDTAFTNKNYATVLIAFAANTFQTTDKLSQTFEEIKDKAFEDSDYQKSQTSLLPLLLPFFAVATPFGIAIIVIIYLVS